MLSLLPLPATVVLLNYCSFVLRCRFSFIVNWCDVFKGYNRTQTYSAPIISQFFQLIQDQLFTINPAFLSHLYNHTSVLLFRPFHNISIMFLLLCVLNPKADTDTTRWMRMVGLFRRRGMVKVEEVEVSVGRGLTDWWGCWVAEAGWGRWQMEGLAGSWGVRAHEETWWRKQTLGILDMRKNKGKTLSHLIPWRCGLQSCGLQIPHRPWAKMRWCGLGRTSYLSPATVLFV